MQYREIFAALGASLAVLVGCGGGGGYGGGGGGGGYGGNLMSAPGEAALTAYLQANHQGTLTATNSGDSYTAQLSQVPNAGTTTFNGSAPAYSAVQTVTLSRNGTQVLTSSTTVYFMISPFVPLGQVSSTGTPYAVVTSSSIPTTLTVGSSSALESLTYYHDSTKATLDGNETDTFAVQARNASTLGLCLTTVISNVTAQGTTDGLADGTEVDCYTVNAAGTAALVSIQLTAGGVMLTFM